MGVRFATHFREIQLRATKTSTPTDAGIDVIHSLVKCLTQNEVPSPLPSLSTHLRIPVAHSLALA